MKKNRYIFFICIFCLVMIVGFFISEKISSNVNAGVPSGYTLDATYDQISLSDLSYGGLSNQEELRENKDTDFSFTKTDNEGSLVFRFKYDVVDNTASDTNAFRVHFDVADNKWDDTNSVWFRGDGVYLKYYNGSSFSWSKKSALTKGMHEIEFGRIALFQNEKVTNNYYVYYKVDGVEIDSTVNPYDVTKMDGTMFINFSSGNLFNKIYDIQHILGPYETPDRISISDLKISGSNVGQSILLNAHTTYSYNSAAEHKSVVLSFLYDCKTPSIVDCQFHFSNTWLGNSHGGIFWLRDDKNRISKAGGGYIETNAFKNVGVYKVELSKLYITSGTNVGKYYLSLSVNGEKVLEYTISDMPDKANIFTTGKNGDLLYDINYMPIELDTDLYLYKWDVSRSGIEFIGNLRKDIVDKQNIKEIGFILFPVNNTAETTRIEGKLIENGSNYMVKAALTSLNEENITRKYIARLYYIMPNYFGSNRTYYSKNISTSFYEELEDLSGLSEENQGILNEIKSKVLNISIDEDTCITTGASIEGDFTKNTITLTGSNSSYSAYVINGELIKNDELIKIGYITYKTKIEEGKITLTKQTKKMVYGGSEHFYEINPGHDEKMTAENLAPMTTELGLTSIRIDINLGDLFSVSSSNTLTVNNSYVAKVKGIIEELKTNGGVTDFLAVLWTLRPNGFKTWDGKPWGEKTAPDPSTQPEMYLKWLQLNEEGVKIAAELFPEITNYEPWNEPEIMTEADGPLAKPDGTNYSVVEKAKILTDLMYYFNIGIKAANPKNIMTTPSICCSQKKDSEFDVTSPQFLTELYKAITDSTPVTGFTEVDKEPNNYFQVINIHPYLARGTSTTNWRNFVKSFHTVSETYGDGGTEIWITEFGFAQNRESNVQSKMLTILGYSKQIEYLTRFYFYKVHDYTNKIDSDRWGLYDYDGNIKAIGTAVKNYINS